MTSDSPNSAPAHHALHVLARKNVLAGLMFIAVAALGLWVSRDYPIGTALRMGTGYVPRLLCWILMGLGVAVLIQGLRDKTAPAERVTVRQVLPVVIVTASLADYVIPSAPEIPDIAVEHLEQYAPPTAGGFRGMGEGGTIGAVAAIANAVADALAPLGIEITEVPVTPARLFQLIRPMTTGKAF